MAKSFMPRSEREFWRGGGPISYWPLVRAVIDLCKVSCRVGEVEGVKKKAVSPSFGVCQDFFSSLIIKRLILIIIENIMIVEKAKANEVGSATWE